MKFTTLVSVVRYSLVCGLLVSSLGTKHTKKFRSTREIMKFTTLVGVVRYSLVCGLLVSSPGTKHMKKLRLNKRNHAILLPV